MLKFIADKLGLYTQEEYDHQKRLYENAAYEAEKEFENL